MAVNYNNMYTFQVVFATPGMLHAGQSLQIFKKWAGNEKNMVSLVRKWWIFKKKKNNNTR